MADKTITLALTATQGGLLWEMLAQKRMNAHPDHQLPELETAKQIQEKLSAAARMVGITMPGIPA